MNKKFAKNLTEAQRQILEEKGTEPPFSGEYVHHTEQGMYSCVVCGQPLFSSDAKFESTSPGLRGWPAFSAAIEDGNIRLQPDNTLGMDRTEILCGNCGAHLGHLFEDVPDDEHPKHYCVNSLALDFTKEETKK